MADELIYRIKFEKDEQTFQQMRSSIQELEDLKRGSGSDSSEASEEQQEFNNSIERMNTLTTEGIDRLIQLKQGMDGYRGTLKEIRDAKKEDVFISEEQQRQEVETEAALKSTSQEYRAQQAALIANTQAQQSGTQTMAQMKAELKTLKQEMEHLPPLGKQFKEKSERVGELTGELKELESEFGDHRRNVGNYAEGMSTAASAIAAFQGPLGPIAGRLNSLNTTIKRMLPMIHAKAAAWGTVATAMALTGIPIIVGGLMAIVAALRSMQPVMDAIEKRWRQLGAVWGWASDRIGWFFGMNEKSNYSLRESIRITGELHDAEKKLEDRKIDLITVNADLEKSIAKLRRQAEDETLSHEDRIEAIDKAIKKSEEKYQNDIDVANEELRIAAQRDDLFRSEREQLEAVAQAEAKVTKAKERSEMQARQLERRRTSIINQLEVEEERRRKNIEAIREEADEAIKASRERQKALEQEIGAELEEQRFERRMEIMRRSGKEEQALRLETEREIKQTKEKYNTLEEEAREKSLKLQSKLEKKYATEGLSEQKASKKARKKSEESLSKEIELIRQEESNQIIAIKEQEIADIQDLQMKRVDDQQNVRDQVIQLREEEAMRQRVLEKSIRGEGHQELLMLEAERNQRELELRSEFLEKKFSLEEAERLASEQSRLEYAQRIADTEKAIEEQALQDKIELREAYADMAMAGLEAMFLDNKAARVAMAIADTWAGANVQLATPPAHTATMRAIAVGLQGMANVRRILQTDIGSSPGGGQQAAAGLSSQRGFQVIDRDDGGGIARQVAETATSSQQDMQPVFEFHGDLDSEVMAIKVRQGNRLVDTKTLTTKSRA